jgi:hypothetical protein
MTTPAKAIVVTTAALAVTAVAARLGDQRSARRRCTLSRPLDRRARPDCARHRLAGAVPSRAARGTQGEGTAPHRVRPARSNRPGDVGIHRLARAGPVTFRHRSARTTLAPRPATCSPQQGSGIVDDHHRPSRATKLRNHDFANPRADPRPTQGATALFNPMPVKPQMGGSPTICGQLKSYAQIAQVGHMSTPGDGNEPPLVPTRWPVRAGPARAGRGRGCWRYAGCWGDPRRGCDGSGRGCPG